MEEEVSIPLVPAGEEEGVIMTAPTPVIVEVRTTNNNNQQQRSSFSSSSSNQHRVSRTDSTSLDSGVAEGGKDSNSGSFNLHHSSSSSVAVSRGRQQQHHHQQQHQYHHQYHHHNSNPHPRQHEDINEDGVPSLQELDTAITGSREEGVGITESASYSGSSSGLGGERADVADVGSFHVGHRKLTPCRKGSATGEDDQSVDDDDDGERTEGGVKLKRKITLINGTALVVGTIIGSGIFVSPKGVFENAGESVSISLLIWTLCGLFSMLGSLCFSELGTTITRSGGEYVYVLQAFGPFAAFNNLWIQLLVIRPTTQAILALTFANYIATPFMDCPPSPLLLRLVAASCICFLTFINCRSVRWAMNVQDVFTFAKLLSLLVIIFSGLVHIVRENKPLLPLDGDPTLSTLSLDQIAFSFYSGLFAFGGWNYINVVTEELKNPYKNLPRAAMYGILITTAVYILANIAYFGVLTSEEIILSPAIVAVFTQRVLPGSAKWFLPVAVAISTFGGLNGILFTTARLFYVASQEGQVPNVMGMISVKRSTPTPSLIASCIMSLVMLVTSDVYELINYFSFTLWLWTGIATASLVHLRFTRPEMKRPIKFPLILPASFTTGCLILTLFAVYADPGSAAYGSALMFVGIPVYFIQKWLVKISVNNNRTAPGVIKTGVMRGQQDLVDQSNSANLYPSQSSMSYLTSSSSASDRFPQVEDDDDDDYVEMMEEANDERDRSQDTTSETTLSVTTTPTYSPITTNAGVVDMVTSSTLGPTSHPTSHKSKSSRSRSRMRRNSGPNFIQVDAKGFPRQSPLTSTHQSEILARAIQCLPHNLSVILIKWHPQPAIRVSWLFTGKNPCEAFQIMYHPIASRFRYIIEVPCSVRNVTIERLLPSTEYLLTVNTVPWPDIAGVKGDAVESNQPGSVYPYHHPSSTSPSDWPLTTRHNTVHITKDQDNTSDSVSSLGKTRDDEDSNQIPLTSHGIPGYEPGSMSPITSFYNNPRYSFQGSAPNVIRFISPQIEYSRFSKFKSSSLIIRRDSDMFYPESGNVLVKKGELAVVLFVLSLWMLIIFTFVKKWGKIRGIETVSTFQGVQVHAAPGMSPSATGFGPSSFPPDPGSGAVPGSIPAHVRGSISSCIGLRSQKSKESDESGSGIHEGATTSPFLTQAASRESATSAGSSSGGGGAGTAGTAASAPVPIPGVVCSSVKKKRLEDAMHQFLVLKNQQAIASGGHGIFTGGSHYYGAYGYTLHHHPSTSSASGRSSYYDQLLTGKRPRSQENPRVSISAACNSSGRPSMPRRGSLEGSSPLKIIRSESHLRLLQQSSRMNRSAENLLIDFNEGEPI